MSALGPGVRRRLLLRSFAVQGSWNYQTLIGTGFAFLLLPALRAVHGHDPVKLRAALARHAELFNSHPYLVTVAAGAVARLEADGAPPELVLRFKNALRGSLGSLGDRLVWLVWRPASALLGLCVYLAGAPWWAGAAAFLLAYNALHLPLRAWGLRLGLRDGINVGRALREAPLQRLGDRAADAGAVLSGLGAVLAFGGAGARGTEYLIGVAAAAAGIALGLRVRPVAFAALLAVLAASLLFVRTS
ncbi:MAG TPA: PTS system mannose/fructose/sorbose family transporter subunit IID [Longimicrobiaceae bacterium]|jgi:mannose/fructose/N-acetylgalactosamine-specific phosphotransferase system component IID|nr:PTS system mannose/fructose/sorbose family transporter subunit IID [Longimicrobiaceae bacterium]